MYEKIPSANYILNGFLFACSIEEKLSDGGSYLEIITADHTKLLAIVPSKRKRNSRGIKGKFGSAFNVYIIISVLI